MIKSKGKKKVQKAIEAICKAHRIGGGDALCALAECGGDEKACMTKLRNPSYRDEIILASDVCEMKNHVKKKSKTPPSSAAASDAPTE
eukprot:CAMPEP_0185749858 /NCGR_PEP_ID=MMETSP1174-20130828/8582_1 /TAXON_ID=35687 /ORGANISM="Dictyocha speculum, Strain CCMP1381" /LENGTH=87 /DNA_ID=CAMNT_0028426159 /DNA_START=31 /DNA_END=291 /DNA_ORIENTATION=-